MKKILNISFDESLKDALDLILEDIIIDCRRDTLKYQLIDWINKEGYIKNNCTYWEDTRDIFIEIIFHNICKANMILYENYDVKLEEYKSVFDNLDLYKILEKQNLLSNNDDGYIWVLNTCIFIIPDYNFTLIQSI